MTARAVDLVRGAPDGLLVHDGDHILDVNPAMLRMVGASRVEEVVGEPVSCLLTTPYLKAVEQQLLSGARGGMTAESAVSFERLCRLDGSTRDVEVTSQLFWDGGRPAVQLALRDVTLRRAAELEANERRFQASVSEQIAAVRTLAGGVAHELNNMLQIIIGFATFLEQDTLTDAQKGDVEEIRRAAAYAATIPRRLSQFAQRARHEPCAVNLAEAVPMWFTAVCDPQRSVRSMLLSCAQAPVVYADPSHMKQVFEIVMANALQATTAQGDVLVLAAHHELQEPMLCNDGRRISCGHYGLIVVQDTGDGIPADVQSHILEPFFTTKQVGQGTGLGLAAAQGMLVQNDGFLTYSSTEQLGSVFTIWLPLHTPTAALVVT